jgi:hypothetical protein
MSSSIDQAFTYAFERNVHHRGQQMESRIRPLLKRIKYDNAARVHFETQLAANMAAKSPVRVQATPVLNVTHQKRYTEGSPYSWGEALDHTDAARILIDPRSSYLQAASYAYGRQIDSVVLAALVGAAGTGLGGSSTTAFDSANQLLNSGGATGLTLDLLRQAKKKFDANEVAGNRICALASNGLEDLLQVTEVTSSDYNTVKALVNGEIDTYLGFKFVRTEQVPQISGRKSVVCFTDQGVGLHLPLDGFTRVGEDPSNSFMLRIYMEAIIGAVRLEETAVVQIDIAA